MEQHHHQTDFNYEAQGPSTSGMMPTLAPQQPLYYPQQHHMHQGYPQQAPDFTSYQPDPNALAYGNSGQFASLPMPLLPTEPLPQACQNEQPKKAQQQSKSKRSPVTPSKKIPEYVRELLERKNDGFLDVDFAERALSNLARKIAGQTSVMDEWRRAIYESDSNSGCVCVVRPKDGRMTITKATGNAGCKKVFPQIFVCQVFRWPNIVFHHDIKSSSVCSYPGVIKPPNVDKSTVKDDTSELICVNPYHYDLSPEAEARFRKQSTPKAKQPKISSTETIAMSTDDEADSDDDVLEYVDDGVDYAALWDSKAVKFTSSEPKKITVQDLLQEMRIFSLNKDLRTFEPSNLEVNQFEKEMQEMIVEARYKKILGLQDKVKPPPKVSDQELMPPPTQPPCPSNVIPQEPDEEDSAIQNLLEDIRGSFERQFDDDFTGLTEPATNDDSNQGSHGNTSRSSSPFDNINIGPTFTMADTQGLEELAASAEDLLASSPDEMPLEGWSMSQEVFDNFFSTSAPSQAPSTSNDGFNQQHGFEPF